MSVLLFLAAAISTTHALDNIGDGVNHVEAVYSTRLLDGKARQIQILWTVDEFTPGDYVRLNNSNGEVLFTSNSSEVDESYGYINTGIPHDPNTEYVVQFLHQDGNLVAESKMHENYDSWMWKAKSALQDLPLDAILWPGSHNSAAHSRARKSSIIGPLGLYQKYVFTQDEDVIEQLRAGARFLDLRIGYYPTNNTIHFWTNHDFFRIYPLQKTIDDVKAFLNESKEIVILDFHHFPVGFDNVEVHDILGQHIVDELGSYMFTTTKKGDEKWTTKLKDVWSTEKRLIISYNRKQIANKFDFFPAIHQIWADAQTTSSLYSYIDNKIPPYWSCRNTYQTAAMAELTATVLGVLTDSFGGLRKMAERVNPVLNLRLLRYHCFADRFQIIAMDFFSTSAVVKVAILSNLRRANESKKMGYRERCDLGCDINNNSLATR